MNESMKKLEQMDKRIKNELGKRDRKTTSQLNKATKKMYKKEPKWYNL